MIPNSDHIPDWISEYIPRDLLDGGTLFKFRAPLRVIESTKCRSCGVSYDGSIDRCTKCGAGKSQLSFKHRTIEVNMVPDLDLDYEILEQQMQHLPSQYAFWAAVYSEVRSKVALQERELKARKGEAITTAQDRARENGIKLPVELVKAVSEADKKVIIADALLQDYQMKCGKLFHMLEALKMKAELARSLAGFKRQEQDKAG